MSSNEDYYLQIGAMGPSPQLPLSKTDFFNLKASKKTLFSAYELEVMYLMVIQNYLDLEKELATTTLDLMITEKFNREFTAELRLKFNTKFHNLLSTTRLYLDQLENQVRECSELNNQEVKETVKHLCSEQYDSNFNYRFMEALRNYTQHQGVAVDVIGTTAGWTEGFENLKYSFKAVATRKQFENTKFKKIILEELPEEVNLFSALRSYIESISSIHDSCRNLISKKVNQSRKNLEDIMTEYGKINSGKTHGLEAYGQTDSNKESFYVYLDQDDVRIKWIDQNPKLVNLSKRYISGEQK